MWIKSIPTPVLGLRTPRTTKRYKCCFADIMATAIPAAARFWQQYPAPVQARFDFVAQGEPATSMFFISRGDVCVYVVEDTPTAGGRIEPPEESYIISLGTGSFFGEVALLDEVRAVAR